MTEEFEEMIEEVEDEVVGDSQSSADCYRGAPRYSPVLQCRRSDY